MTFPTIFVWLERFSAWRGFPAVYGVLITAVIIIIAWDWRLAIFSLAAQYFFAGLLFVDLLDPRLVIIKVLAGWFACLILTITARQVNWGRLPVDVTPEEATQFTPERRAQVGPISLPTWMPLRAFLALLMLLVVTTLAQRLGLPLMTDSLSHVNLAVYTLAGMGLLGLAVTAEPLKAGLGVFMFLTGFELFYSALEQSVPMLAMLAAVTLIVAVAIAHLIHSRHALPALLD
jgi:hypothetical protein